MARMSTKLMYALEYESGDGQPTFDIFKNYKKATDYAKLVKSLGYQYRPLYIFKAEFNIARIYIEEDVWNYDDCSDTFSWETVKILKRFKKHHIQPIAS